MASQEDVSRLVGEIQDALQRVRRVGQRASEASMSMGNARLDYTELEEEALDLARDVRKKLRAFETVALAHALMQGRRLEELFLGDDPLHSLRERSHLMEKDLRTALRQSARDIHNLILRDKRTALLEGGTTSSGRVAIARRTATQQGQRAAAKNTTEVLRRSARTLAQEVGRQTHTLEALHGSTAVLDKVDDEVTLKQSGYIDTAKSLLGALDDEDLKDRATMVVGLLVFFCICIFVLAARLRQ